MVSGFGHNHSRCLTQLLSAVRTEGSPLIGEVSSVAHGVWSSFLLWGTISIRLHHPPDPQLRKQETRSLPRSSHVSLTSVTLLALENPFNGKEGGREGGKEKRNEEEARGS